MAYHRLSFAPLPTPKSVAIFENGRSVGLDNRQSRYPFGVTPSSIINHQQRSPVLILHRGHTGKQLSIVRRGGDVQIVDMAMRRLQANLNDAERLEVSLKALAKHSLADVEQLTRQKTIPRMMEIVEIYKQNPIILHLVISVLSNMITMEYDQEDVNRTMVMWDSDIFPIAVQVMKKPSKRSPSAA
jgi:hypothetical protein